MPSDALAQLENGIVEIQHLRTYPKAQGINGASNTRAQFIAASRRAGVVLLCSHYERYLYGLNDSVFDHLNRTSPQPEKLPISLLLRQVKEPVEILAMKDWTKREDLLRIFFDGFTDHWISGPGVSRLDAQANISWMKSPKVEEVIRLFRLFGIQNIVQEVTRTESGRRSMMRDLQGLVDARNGIAHGDQTIQPTGPELTRYLGSVRNFCERADRRVGQTLARNLGADPPW